MQAHQIFDLCLGIVMVLLGLIGLGRDVTRVLTHRFPGEYDDWRSLSASLFFAADGPSHCSKAFDLPHHESHRTAVLVGIALPVMFAVIIANLVAQVVIGRRKRASQTMTDATQPAA